MRNKKQNILPLGKLPIDMLNALLNTVPKDDPDIIVGPELGEDSAVLRMGDKLFLFKTDPITFATEDIASYLIAVNANDIACTGGIPKYLLVTLLLPEGKTTTPMVERLFKDILNASQKQGISLLGGHTEITHGIDRPIAIGFMIGYSPSGEIFRTSGAKPGDFILLSKGVPLEAISLLAREMGSRLPLDKSSLQAAKNLINDPGISVVKEARIAIEQGGVTAMHDPTEGGLATGLLEVAKASHCGVDVYMKNIPVIELAKKILPKLNIDPLGALSSGALIVCCKEKSAKKIIGAWDKASIKGSIIGRITENPECILHKAGESHDLPLFYNDEITKVFS